MKAFELGTTYVMYAYSGAHFRAKAIKRTKCTITFELSDAGRRYTRQQQMSFRLKSHAVDGGMEYIEGKKNCIWYTCYAYDEAFEQL